MDYGLPKENITSIPLSAGVDFDINGLLVFLFLILAGFFILLIIKIIIKKIALRRRYNDHAIYLIRLPKEKPDNGQREENDLRHLQEEIARGETVFASIGGLRAQRGIKPWLFGRNDHFSFEVVASQKLISFYATAPRSMSR